MECLDGKQEYHALVDTNAIYILAANWQAKVQKETAKKEHAREGSWDVDAEVNNLPKIHALSAWAESRT